MIRAARGDPAVACCSISGSTEGTQASSGLPVRFSNGGAALRSIARGAGPREQPGSRVEMTAARLRARLENLRLILEQLLERCELLHGGELGVFDEPLAVAETFLEGLAHVDEHAVEHTDA